MRRSLSAMAVCFGVLAGGAEALAQGTSTPIPSQDFHTAIDVQAFRPAPGPNNFLTVHGARVDGQFAFAMGGWFNYANGALTIYNARCPSEANDSGCTLGDVRSRPVAHLMTLNLQPTVTVARRVQISLDIPLSVANGDQVRGTDAMRVPQNPPLTGDVQQTTFALADPRLDVKVRLVGEGMRGPAFALNIFGQFPLGRYLNSSTLGAMCPAGTSCDPSLATNFVGGSNVGVGARLIGDFRQGRFSMAANAGFFTRVQSDWYLSSASGSSIIWGVAAGVDITPRLTGLLEFFGSHSIVLINNTSSQGSRVTDSLQQHAIEADLGVRYRLGDLSLTAGGGTGVLRGVGVPLVRGFIGAVYAPFRVDTDRDGVMDDVDRCPTEPEDRDGYEDEDGCPELDNDGDGIADLRDRCPNEPEDRDNFQDADGCPDRDNDNDGIPDGYDTCPLQPEDRDGDRDEDGCPDNDRDRDGVPDDRDRCPTEAEDTDGFQDEDGCPDPDNDNDRVLDAADQCGEEPETYNGFQDDDGCPDTVPDRDHDGIPDDRDRCPDQPETYNGITDDDGCPERGPSLVRLEGGLIRILTAVNFATDSDRIVGRRSFQVLDAVVAVMAAHAELAHVEVQGHTDDRGDAAHNRDLSQRRAAAVVTYLTAHSVAAGRLTARGFGPDHPIESNAARGGRAHNRRVEFHIVGPGGGAASQQVPEGTPAPATTAPATTAPATTAPATTAPATTAPATTAPATTAPATTAPATTAPATRAPATTAPAATPPAAPATRGDDRI